MSDRVGQQLGNYRLIRLLGRGGFAEVYLGEHLRLGTQAGREVLREPHGIVGPVCDHQPRPARWRSGIRGTTVSARPACRPARFDRVE